MRPEELESLALKDPLSYGISYIDLLENRKWSIGDRLWLPDIYQEVNPYYIEKYPDRSARRMVVTKSTQSGISTMMMTRMYHLADFWPVRLLYMLPRQQDVLDFVGTRVDPMIRQSPRLAKKLGNPDSTRVKRLGDSYLFYGEASVEPRMMPIDALFIDEVDLSDPNNVATALNRLDASNWKLNYFISTPTIANYGIHGLFETSDKRRWLVRCRHCNTDQPLVWDDNLKFTGAANNPTKVFYGCAHCSEELTQADIQAGRWVAEQPDLSRETVGFHISQMMIYTAAALYKHFRDPQSNLLEFYRKRLGMPFELGEGSLDRDDFLVNCFTEPVEFENEHDGVSQYYLGVDQGNELQIVVGKKVRGSRYPRIVHTEIVPFDVGFRRVGELMNKYRIRRGVIDANPNRHSAKSVADDFPGRLLLADYAEQKIEWSAKKGEKNHLEFVTINRTQTFDALFKAIRDGEWLLPGQPPALHPDVELLIDHVTALRRDIEKRRTAGGEVDVGVYRKIRADHLAHAWGYMRTAMLVDKGKDFRMRVLNGEDDTEEVQEPGDPNQPAPEILDGIARRLTEVPEKQIRDYLLLHAQDDYDVPFPLSFKLGKLQDTYTLTDIQWVMRNHLLKQ